MTDWHFWVVFGALGIIAFYIEKAVEQLREVVYQLKLANIRSGAIETPEISEH